MPSEAGQWRQSAASVSSVPLGTARWITPDEALGRFSFDDQLFSLNSAGLWVGKSNGQVWIGETADQRLSALGYRDDRHVFLVSAIRGGKGTSVIIPNLCLWPGSCIVIDPKGENATVTAARRAAGSAYAYGMGQTVRILDPFDEIQVDPSLKARFNPLDTIEPSKVTSRSTMRGAWRRPWSLSKIVTTHFGKRLPVISSKASLLHVPVTDPEFAGCSAISVSVWRLVNQGDWMSVDALRQAGEKGNPIRVPPPMGGTEKLTRRSTVLLPGVGEQLCSAWRIRPVLSVLGTAKTNLEFPCAGRPCSAAA